MPEGGGWEACVRSCCPSSRIFRDELELREVERKEGHLVGRKNNYRFARLLGGQRMGRAWWEMGGRGLASSL